jgi:hypothetical protein
MDLSSGMRSATSRRALRTWCPPGLDIATAGTVVYVHGYFTTVDKAWNEHKLAVQFEESRQNALFVAVSAAESKHDGVAWESLSEVRRELATTTGMHPAGPVVVVAHSGGYRTVARWIESGDTIDQVTLLDALYGNVHEFGGWIGDDQAPRRTMNLVVCHDGSPHDNAGLLTSGLQPHSAAEVVHRRGVPARYGDFSEGERRARLLHIIAQQTHMGLVAQGQALPVLLRRSPLRLLADVGARAKELS